MGRRYSNTELTPISICRLVLTTMKKNISNPRSWSGGTLIFSLNQVIKTFMICENMEEESTRVGEE